MPLTPHGIIGLDGHVPIQLPEIVWRFWALKDIYMGTLGENRYVPKVGDYIEDTDEHVTYQVTAISELLIPTLERITPIPVGVLSPTDTILSAGPNTFRVYIDKSVTPYVMAVDARLKVHGVMARSAKIIRGSELDGSARVISLIFNNNGGLVGQTVPLELVEIPNGVNYSVYSIPVCHTTDDLPDGEVVTAILYNDNGHVISKQQLIVENTAFIRSSDTSTKYVSGISLESPFMSGIEEDLVLWPKGFPMEHTNFRGRVHYSDGSSITLPVDGTRFKLAGMENFVATQAGQRIPLLLYYTLGQNEIAYVGTTMGGEHTVVRSYRCITDEVQGKYNVKLYPYPVWVDSLNGYRLTWHMLNLDRDMLYDVTPYVSFTSSSAAFNPIGYGVNQRLSVSINLNQVNGIYKSVIHVQTVDIRLLRQGTEQDTNWMISFSPGQNPPYGQGMRLDTEFVNQNLTRVRVNQGLTDFNEWVEKLYYNTHPLYDPDREIGPLEPTHFVIVNGSHETEFPISQWNSQLISTMPIANMSTVYLKFIRRMPITDLILSLAGLPVYQSN